ncbi:hypothetical protein C7T94_17155 [Pedobacter yulinensis]|uniref:Zinc-dependent metalloprotease n=1 Tax=Pedobacter yulinensis TaxID=2126353 RepID=A0A2T3HHL1_9SPHI|nr:zinc-dependent metalloprotease [Pedobacter yulinensis]PST81922.1 hypothetical protein C7T94_17155 [Pedobacter yulinensis]
MKKNLLTLAVLVAATSWAAHAQTRPTGGTDSVRRSPGTTFGMPGATQRAQPKPYESVITNKALTRKGMITSHKVEDKFYFEIPDSILNRDILVVSRISKAGAEVRAASGYAGDDIGSRVIRFEKAPNNRVFMRKMSFRTYSADSTADMYQSLQRSNVQAIAAAFNVAAYTPSKNGSVIDMTDYLNQDNDIFFFASPMYKTRFRLGAQQSDRSYIQNVRSFPMNVEISTVKTYALTAPSASPFGGGGASPMASMVSGSNTVELNSSMVLLPKVPMKPRYFDPRVGYFTVGYTDFDQNPQGVKEVELVKRWRLEPKAADLARYKRGELVEPVKPIVFYIDPATPKKWVPYLIAGVNDWQKAFEKAGFKNAIIGKMAPTAKEDSTWSLDDARHSAIVYKPSEIPNASGPSIADPRSGEIMESHINWYHNVMKLVHDWYMIQTAAVDPRARKMTFSDELMGDLIRFVSSHEVGHTLGLRHNYGSSSTVDVEKLRDKAWVEANGHTPSIMDYARFNYVAQPEDKISKKGLYPRIGDYDLWAIEWGYKLLPGKGGAAEIAELNKMTLTAAQNPRLWFGTETNPDDPRSQNEDLSGNAMKASTYGIKNLKVILKGLPEWTRESNEGYENLSNMYGQLTTQFGRYMGHVSKNIGGIMETPKTVEQSGAVYVRTPAASQREAMAFLNENLFRTPTWMLDQAVLDQIDENPLEVVGKLQNATLNRLVSSYTILKLVSAEAADGGKAYKATDMLGDLNNYIFTELNSNQDIDVYRRNLQKMYVDKLISIVKPAPALQASAVSMGRGSSAAPRAITASSSDVISVVKGQLRELQTKLKNGSAAASGMAKYHLEDLSDRIESALDTKG